MVADIRHLIKKSTNDLDLDWGNISNDSGRRAAILSDSVVNELGFTAVEKFVTWPYIWVGIANRVTTTDVDIDRSSVDNLTKTFMYYVDELITSLWLIKDNSCHRGVTIVRDLETNPIPRPIIAYSTKFATTCDFRGLPTAFTDDELKSAEEHFKHMSKLGKESGAMEFKPTDEGNATANAGLDIPEVMKYDNLHIIQRAMSFLSMARMAQTLHLKITNYVMVLECLFSYERSGVTRHVTNRTGSYLESDLTKRQEIIKLVNDAYNVRSRYVHGQKLGDEQDNTEFLLEIVRSLDNIVRRVILKAIYNDPLRVYTNDDDSKVEWFKTII